MILLFADGSLISWGIIPAIIAGIGAIAAAVIPIIADAADGSEDEQRAAQDRAMAEARRVWEQLPPADQEQVSPDMLLGEAMRAGVEADPASIAAQQDVMGQLDQLSRPGLNAEDMYMLDQGRRRAGQFSRGQREAALQQQSARGMGGSNAALLASLNASQSGAEALHDSERAAQANASRRALEALGMRGQMAGAMRGQSFDEGYRRASAVDEFNARNTAYRQDVQGRNVDRANQRTTDRAAGMTGQYNRDADVYGQRYDQTQARDDARLAGAIQAGAGLGSAIGEGIEGDDDENPYGGKKWRSS